MLRRIFHKLHTAGVGTNNLKCSESGAKSTHQKNERESGSCDTITVCSHPQPPENGLGSVTEPARGCEHVRDSGKFAGVDGGLFYVHSYDTMISTSTGTSGEEASQQQQSKPMEVYCDLKTEGGGWSLLMAAADHSDPPAFPYDSAHWTTNSVLNDLIPGTENNGLVEAIRTSSGIPDAKYSAFNNLRVREFMAVWPQRGNRFKEPVTWKIGPFRNTTALEFFSTPQVIDASPTRRPDYKSTLFSSQSGAQQYGIAHVTSSTRVRWGYSWNDQNSWSDSSEAVGGIGVQTGTGFDPWPLSAGDKTTLEAEHTGEARVAAGGNRKMAVLIYGRSGGDAEEEQAIALQPARDQQQVQADKKAGVDANDDGSSNAEPEVDKKSYGYCNRGLDCASCVGRGCAWCLMDRKCVSDEPWICSGDHDHVSPPNEGQQGGDGIDVGIGAGM